VSWGYSTLRFPLHTRTLSGLMPSLTSLLFSMVRRCLYSMADTPNFSTSSWKFMNMRRVMPSSCSAFALHPPPDAALVLLTGVGEPRSKLRPADDSERRISQHNDTHAHCTHASAQSRRDSGGRLGFGRSRRRYSPRVA
jgi:hypothetical protein